MSTTNVDDSQLIYSGTGWQTQECSADCVAAPSPDQVSRDVFENSWHTASGSDLASASFTFTGTSVNVFGFSVGGKAQYVEFLLDGSPAGNYSAPAGAKDAFNVQLTQPDNLANLANTEHTLEMRVPQPDVAGITIDYLQISSPPTASSIAPSQTPTPVAGRTSVSAGVLAGILSPLIIILIALAAYLVARRGRLTRGPRPTPAPYPFSLDAEASSAPSGTATPRFINPPVGAVHQSESGFTGSGTLELTAPSFVRSPVSETAPHSFSARSAAHLPTPLVVQNDV